MAKIFNVQGSNDTIHWEAEPATRGTFTILSTCIVTLSLCVWSCVHLNLPGEGGKYRSKFLRRLAWIIGALIVPEYLIMVAWDQRQTAKRISKEVTEAFKPKRNLTADPESQSLQRRHPWTMTHSFPAIMGGIAIDPGDSDHFIPQSRRSTLTPNGVSLLLKHEPQSLPDVSEEEVKDKSKGSLFTKFVACIQAIWFCLSCIARLSQKLPVSLLELNTFAHAFGTVIVYILWWRKPIDIERPLVVREDSLRPLVAYMWMASKTSCIPKPTASKSMSIKVGRDPEFEAIIDGKKCGANSAIDSSIPSASPIVFESISQVSNVPSRGTPSMEITPIVKVRTTQELQGTGFRVNGQSTRWKVSTTHEAGENSYTYVSYRPAVFNLTPCDVRRWRLAREAMDKYDLDKPNTNLDLITVKTVPETMNGPDEKPDIWAIWAYLGFSLVAAGYGGLHTLAWNAHFPTHRELKLWRISALIITTPAALMVLLWLIRGAIFFLLFMFDFCYRKLVPNPNPKPMEKSPLNPPVVKEKPASWKKGCFGKMVLAVWGALGAIVPALVSSAILLLYLPARIYLVYESFRTVFFLPPEAYTATSWPQYLPHIT